MRTRGLVMSVLLGIVACSGADERKAAAPSTSGGSHDWPQWRGPQRTMISTEKGLLQEWPKAGPTLAWKVSDLGGGYSTPSIAAGRIFGMSYRGNDEVVWALDEANGNELWVKRIAKKGSAGYNEGPRSTPTVEGDVLYTLGISGDLVCLKVADGTQVWHVPLRKDYKGNVGGWGYSESVLIDGDKVIVASGGPDAAILALNKKDGSLIWKSKVPQGDHAHYASAIVAEIGGKRQYIHFLSGGVVSVAADDGAFLWRYDAPHNGTANCSTPLYHDGAVFAASSYGTGGGLVKVTGEGTSFEAKQEYFTKSMKNHHGGMILLDGYLYGSNEGLLTCLDWKTGKVKWEERKPGKGAIAYADGRLYYRNEGSGTVFLVDANPEKYVERGQLKQPNRTSHNAWAHPVIANGKLYLRDQGLLFCYDLKKGN